jgi:hypothetical protein
METDKCNYHHVPPPPPKNDNTTATTQMQNAKTTKLHNILIAKIIEQ